MAAVLHKVVSYLGYHRVDSNEINLKGVIFLKKFGVFKKGEHVSYLSVNISTGVMQSYFDFEVDSILDKKQEFTLTPITK